MSAIKMLLDELLEKVGLPLHGYMMNVPYEMREDAIKLWNENHREVCQCQELRGWFK